MRWADCACCHCLVSILKRGFFESSYIKYRFNIIVVNIIFKDGGLVGVPGLQPFKAKVMSFGHSACFATHQQAFRQYLGESTHDAMLQEVQIGVQVYQFDNRKKDYFKSLLFRQYIN